MEIEQRKRLELEAQTYIRRAQEDTRSADANWLAAGKALRKLKENKPKG